MKIFEYTYLFTVLLGICLLSIFLSKDTAIDYYIYVIGISFMWAVIQECYDNWKLEKNN
ncbi:hypothetical protein [Mammaliicoccus sciuri]|uniref:hypothetical protein n=1 Tax=Mammaliicoccus sciuri TaxID=1296 RepID=UPI00194FE37B